MLADRPSIRGSLEGGGGVEDRIEQAGEVKDITIRPTRSINLGPCGLTETEPPIKEHAGLDLGPYTFLAYMQLGFHSGSLAIGGGVSLTLLPGTGSTFSR
jgi:hypothetical protein